MKSNPSKFLTELESTLGPSGKKIKNKKQQQHKTALEI